MSGTAAREAGEGGRVAGVRALLGALAARIHAVVTGGLDAVPAGPLVGEDDPALAALVAGFGLDAVDAGLLVAAAAPELDPRIGALYAGLDPGRGRSHVRVDVALALAGGSLLSAADRARLGADAKLLAGGLLEPADAAHPDAAFPERTLRTPERVVQHLLGDDSPDPLVLAAQVPVVHVDTPAAVEVARSLEAGWWTVWVRDGAGTGRSAGASALAALGAPAVSVDTARLPSDTALVELLRRAVRDARLVGGGVVAGPLEARRDADAIRALAGLPACPLVLLSRDAWDPSVSPLVPVQIDATPLGFEARAELWGAQLGVEGAGVEGAGAAEAGVVGPEVVGPGAAETVAVARELAMLRLAPEQLPVVASAAAGSAVAEGAELALAHLRRAALTVGASRLDAHAVRVVPRATFRDLVLPDDLMAELHGLPDRYRTRDIVRDQWQLGHRTGGGRGITCLFAGPSGTGKTTAAEAVAHALGVELFVIDLSQIVDKYIGETEKNLERVFTEAEGVNGVLLFDEADALFGKRTDVRSSHDRHANVEVAYLLQRMERYDGVAVLTTNLRANLDEAFTRRLDVVCSFPEPGPAERRALWEMHLPPSLPRSGDVDVDVLATHLVMPGGVIRNVAVTAAHTAAASGQPVSQRTLVDATRREFAKLGRLFPDDLAARLQ